jgi:hypothetical protein
MTSITNSQAHDSTATALSAMQREFRAAGWSYTFRKQSAMGEWAWTKGTTTICVDGWHGQEAAIHGAQSKVFGRVHLYENDRVVKCTEEPSYPSGCTGMPNLVAVGRGAFRIDDVDARFYVSTVLPQISAMVLEYRTAMDSSVAITQSA